MRVEDLGVYGGILIVIVVANSYLDLVPWFPHIAIFVGILGALLIYYKRGGDGIDFTFSGIGTGSEDSSSELKVQVEPDEAPQKLNEKVRNHPARKELRIDRTHRDSTDFKDMAREVTINGKEKLFWGVIGRPRNSKYSEKMRYIYNLTDDRIFAYDAEVKSIQGRLDPFYGYEWLTVRGRDASRSSGGAGRNQFFIGESGESGDRSPIDDGGG